MDVPHRILDATPVVNLALSLIYSIRLRCDQPLAGNEVELPLLDGSRSVNVMDGVGYVNILDSLQAIGGYLPNMPLYDSLFRVLRWFK